jgi:hypothetical protein
MNVPEDAAGPFELESTGLGALPVIGQFLGRIDLAGTLASHLPAGDPRTTLPAATAIGVLVCNLCVAREPLYGLAGWAAGFEPGLLGLVEGEAGLLNDDRVGRALDQLFDADRSSLLCKLVLRAVREFGIDCSQLHNDSTSLVLHGDYDAADGHQRGGKPTVLAARGHSKDHRPDLKQLVLILTVTADGAVPLTHRLAAGNTNDDRTHIDTWDELRALTGGAGFLYVADSKLCTREQMSHIDCQGGRFVTVLPRTRREDGQLRDWMSASTPEFTEAVRRPGKRHGDPEQVWQVAPAPFPSSEGHRIVWVHSSVKAQRDETARHGVRLFWSEAESPELRAIRGSRGRGCPAFCPSGAAVKSSRGMPPRRLLGLTPCSDDHSDRRRPESPVVTGDLPASVPAVPVPPEEPHPPPRTDPAHARGTR